MALFEKRMTFGLRTQDDSNPGLLVDEVEYLYLPKWNISKRNRCDLVLVVVHSDLKIFRCRIESRLNLTILLVLENSSFNVDFLVT